MFDGTLKKETIQLLAAADYIEKNGWFSYGDKPHDDGDSSACAILALGAVSKYNYHSPLVHLLSYLNLDVTRYSSALVAWNDSPGRTKAEVLAAFRGAAAILTGVSS